MTAEEVAQFEAGSQELAAAMSSAAASEPRCLARAFATPRAGALALAMQGWIDLDAVRSPLLLSEPLENEADLLAAAEIFGLDLAELSAAEIADCALAMERAAREAFALHLPMREPDQPSLVHHQPPDGFGAWLPLWAFLIATCGMDPDDARRLRVDHAYALMAGVRRNQGWEVAGEPYALRTIDQPSTLNDQPADA